MQQGADGDEGSAPECAACVKAAKRVFCGGEHTLLRDPDTLAVFQLGACGLGFDHDNPDAAGTTYTRQVPLPGPAAGVFAGYYHNLVKLIGGRCVAYGCGRQAPNDGQLFNGSISEDTAPVPTGALRSFADAALGGHHSVCRTRGGEVWAAGAGWQGQMGNGGLQYKNPQPVRVPDLPTNFTERLAGGYYHTAALGGQGDCYVWGCNEQGQLGVGKPEEGPQVTRPQRLSERVPELVGSGVKAFAGGYGHSALLLLDGRVLTLGNHSEGQRALDPDLDIDAPGVANEVSGLPGPADAIAAGNHHTLVVVDGRTFAFGSNEYGQVLGQGAPPPDAEDKVWQPQAVAGLPSHKEDPVVHVSAGICHSAAQTASGRVFLWGCGGNGQTGDSSLSASVPVTEININEIAQRCRRTAE
eukprot:gnl/TRDRNA2_/TRDRNA2_68833_c0_seq1.p1 gnl/TRDRNA2_/TRDRNA2_68833_c0~~gnl/TRDRNA2_/TRDRNA2_68833_c0_seq1.p1  ORF type:complete len:413 (+),score=47.46 gnl/TRDRNA2_/TRDRNA2_68833_c0_seq1:17-1255(+)